MNHDELVEDSNLIHNVQTRQKLMQKLSRDNAVPALVSGSNSFSLILAGMTGMTPGPYSYSGSNPLYTPFAGVASLMMNQPVHFSSQSHCVLMSNLFDPHDSTVKEDPNFYDDTRDDVFDECSKFGKVEIVYVDPISKDGNVWVKFADKNVEAATKAIEAMNGR
jgi:RNA-binding protein 39